MLKGQWIHTQVPLLKKSLSHQQAQELTAKEKQGKTTLTETNPAEILAVNCGCADLITIGWAIIHYCLFVYGTES